MTKLTTYLIVLQVILSLTNGFTLPLLKSDRNLETDNLKQNKGGSYLVAKYPSVRHFARHGLCRTFKGKQLLYKALKSKLCTMKLSFTASIVMDLCRFRNSMLDTWVAALFDINDDGYISHFERRFHADDN